MKVLIAGEVPFANEVGDLCQRAGHDTTVYFIEDFYDAIESGYLLEATVDIDVAIELHNESAEAKEELLNSMGQALPANTLLLTSALPTSTTQAAAWVPNQSRVVGFGIMPPLKDKIVVELASGINTADSSMAEAQAFWESLGVKNVVVKDGAALVRARVIGCLMNEAVGALMEGIASAKDIDTAMRLGTNYPHGPLEWADYIGLDAVLGIMRGLYAEWQEDRYRPSPLLRRMVIAGKLGRKSGEGFYHYD